MRSEIQDAVLYGIVDRGYIEADQCESVTRELIAGGAGIIQLRAKQCGEEEVERLSRLIAPHCKRAEVPFIVNDFPEIARRVNADGLHIGQDDGTIEEAREVVGEDIMIGRSTHSLEQARQALIDGFDYIGFGPLFPTPTKKGRPGIGMENISLVQQEVGSKIPVFCIGGITRSNLQIVLENGAKRVVIVSDLLKASSVEDAASSVSNKIKNFK